MVRNVAPLMRDLEDEDFYLLSGVEQGMRFGEWVDRDQLPKYCNLDEREVSYRLDRCLDRELIERRTMQYEGYRLTFGGYDILALRTFAERGTIAHVGAPLGEGKESDVLEAKNGDLVALKFHREGLTNFREVMKERDYTASHDHVSWLYTARKAAEHEFDVLTELYPLVRVPEPIDANRHALVMERMEGRELGKLSLPSEHVVSLFQTLLGELGEAHRLGYIHADISEYNVFVSEHAVTIFDWPQAIPVTHPNATELLQRDVTNLVSYFSRKYPQFTDAFPPVEAIITAISQHDRSALVELFDA